MKPVSSGYADVNGIKLYHEIYGEGEPLVLIHGGLTTIGEMQGWVQPLAKTRRVIAVETQGHGRTADTDRPMSFTTLGDDIAVLLDHLEIPKADLVGHSFGGASAIRAAIQQPEKVRRLVVISSPYARTGWYPEAQRGMSHVSAAMAENMMQTPTGKFSKQWPEPQRFPQFLDKIGNMMSEDYDWSADIAKLPMPVLLVFADNDSVSQKHFALLGGGVRARTGRCSTPCRSGPGKRIPTALVARVLTGWSTLPESLFLKALTEGLPMIESSRHMPSDDGQILRNLWSHPMTAADFRRIALSLEGVEEYSHAGLPAFRVGGRKFASLASQAGGYGNLRLTLEQQAAFVEEAPEIFSPIPGGWGKMGHTHIRLAAASERGCTDGCTPNGV